MTDSAHIERRERQFWDTMITKDAAAASAMLADQAIVVGARGAARIGREDFARMMKEGKWTLEEYTFKDVEVLFRADDVAIIGYKVTQKGSMNGKSYDFEAADSTTWMRSGGEWLCALHTETPLGQHPMGQ
jgi:ketosteroid isomerase-like protein